MLISDDIQIRNMSRWFSISDNPADFLSITPAEARKFYRRARDAYGPYSSLAGFNFYDEAARDEGFGPALITVDGKRTSRYNAAKKISTTWLHQVGRELKPPVSESVVHANETPLPNGTVGFTPTDLVTGVTGQPVVLGTFRSRDQTVKDRWLLVANRSHGASARATVLVNPAKVSGVEVFQAISKSYGGLRGNGVPVSLAPGAATLLRLTVR